MMEKNWFDLLCRPYKELEKDQQESIYKKYRIFIYPYLYALLSDHSLTEDLIHESFLKISSRAPQLQSMRNIPAWIKRVAYTTAIDFIRKAKKEAEIFNALVPLYETSIGFSVETVLEKNGCMRNCMMLSENYKITTVQWWKCFIWMGKVARKLEQSWT